MATLLNTAICITDTAFTGSPDCPFVPGKIAGAYIVPEGFELTAANLADETALVAALQAAIIDVPAKRIYPIYGFSAVTDNTSDPTTRTTGYGSVSVVTDGDNNWLFEYDASVCVNNQAQKFNRSKWRVIFFDDTNALIGTKNKTGDGMKGIPNMVYVYPWKVADGTNPALFRIQFVHKPVYVNGQLAFAPTSNTFFSDLPGVQAVKVTVVSRAAAVINVTAAKSCGNISLRELFGTELAVAAAWSVVNSTSGNVVTVTSVATTPLGWALTLDSADPDYNTTANGMQVSLASASVLAGLGLINYDSKKVNIPSV